MDNKKERKNKTLKYRELVVTRREVEGREMGKIGERD